MSLRQSLESLSSSRAAVAGILLAAVIIASKTLERRRRNPRSLPLPPGPTRLPLIGSLLQIPQEKPWEVYDAWRKEYGDIIYMEALGQPILVLNSPEDCINLMEKRAVNYSDRAEIPAVEMMSLTWSFALMTYGSWWRDHRRAFHQYLNQTQVSRYRPVFEEETRTFLKSMLGAPDDFFAHIRLLFGSIIIRAAYGATDSGYNKALIEDSEILMEGFAEMVVPGRLMVNLLPILRHVPGWLPGTGWKKELEKLSVLSKRILTKPFDDVKARVTNGLNAEQYPSMCGSFLEKQSARESTKQGTEEIVVRNAAALAYLGGIDTSVSSSQGLFLALAMHPEVQIKARAELESVIGPERLPHPDDIDRLPYVRAIVKELGRWHVIVPLCVPHQSRDDDEYKGYFIPAGTVIMPNAWSILHNPEFYPDPFAFNPDRFLEGNGSSKKITAVDPSNVAFGYGRRLVICPGRHFSNDITAFMVASILSVFDIKPPKNEGGERILLKLDTLSDLVA
ncbi:cytochrome P450 [Coprinopsis sp. MPI-PUGE-AT-0042]|nr:cytochrome P450 [Coprinopsis sp. MPI-PUGE-AT-0042]